MSNTTKDVLGALAVGILSVALFIAFMASMVMLGQSAGHAVRIHVTAAPADTSLAPPAQIIDFSLPDSAGADSSRVDPLLDPRFAPTTVAGVPVLCYHYLRHSTGPLRVLKVLGYVVLSLPLLDDNELWTESESAFDRQMRYLRDHGYHSISLDQLTAWQCGRDSLPPKPVVITFDDGDRSVYDYAWPILRRYGMRATLFVITGRVGVEWRGLHTLTWAEIRELADSGVFSIQSHSHDMHYKVGDKYHSTPVFLAGSEGDPDFDHAGPWQDYVLRDLRQSREEIARHVGRAPRYLAWPYGQSDDAVDRLARRAGFEQTLLLAENLNEPFVTAAGDTTDTIDRVTIPRYAVSARTSWHAFLKMLAGTYHSEPAH